MNHLGDCATGKEVRIGLERGALTKDLALHAESCASCGEVAELTTRLHAFREAEQVFVPPLGRIVAHAEIAAMAAKRKRLSLVTWISVAVSAVITCTLVAATGHAFPLANPSGAAGLILAVSATIFWCDVEEREA